MQHPPTQVTCVDIKGQTYSVPTTALTFRPAVYGIIVKDDKILLSKQWDGYDFPGGGIELGEPTEAALIREVKEETGLDITVGKIVQCAHSFFKLPFGGKFVHSIHMYYACHVVGGELSTEFFDEDEKIYATKAEWLSLNQIKKLKFCSSVSAQEILANYVQF